MNKFGATGNKIDIQKLVGNGIVKIFLAVQQTNQKIELQKFIRRVCCYVFAGLHAKQKSVDQIVQKVKEAVQYDQEGIRHKVYNIIRIGEAWKEIINDFASALDRDPQDCRGILCVLEPATP